MKQSSLSLKDAFIYISNSCEIFYEVVSIECCSGVYQIIKISHYNHLLFQR